jgi:hypothetical protein
MPIESKALQPAPLSENKQQNNRCEELLPLLAPVVVNAPHIRDAWKKLNRKVVTYLINTVARNKQPWLNQLSLAAVVYNESGTTRTLTAVVSMNLFLRWAIPTYYPDVASLDPAEALVAYFGDPPQPKCEDACSAYNGLQIHMLQYLESLSADECKKLEPFAFPPFFTTPKLTKLRAHVISKRQAKRKEQTHAIVRDLVSLVAMGRQRYKWLADLDAQVQQVAEAVKNGQATLPAVIKCFDLDKREELTFRVWNRKSWIQAHRGKYTDTCKEVCDSDGTLFLQLVGALPDTSWFLRAIEVGALMGRPSPASRQYLREYNVAVFYATDGLLHSGPSRAHVISKAQSTTSGTPDDSRILFGVEPLLAAAALGLFALVCITQTAMRMGELQQVTFDDECIRIGRFPQVLDARCEGWSEERMFLYLYPKGSNDRQPYAVTSFMQEALTIWMQMHERFCGAWKQVPANVSRFTHARRFPGKHKFALQWRGKHLDSSIIESCLDFLLLEHTCLDSNGNPTRITAHALRHGLAGYLRNQGVPLEDIMALLKQVNIAVTDYYSKLSPQDLYNKIGPMLTRLGELAEIDPATVRTEGDLNNLIQAALKRFGVLCHIPGGSCCSFESCEVQFRCASCLSFVPDPARRHEVENQIAVCKKAIQLFEAEGDQIQAGNQRSHLHSWERVLKELDALAAVQFETRPLSEMLNNVGIHKTDNELRTLPKHQPELLPGGNQYD